MRLGSDPEFFLTDNNNGDLVPICGKIGADKWSPLQLPGLSTGFCIQEDNVAVEFNIPPCETKEKFTGAIKTVRQEGLKYIQNLSKKKSEKSALTFSRLCAYVFPQEALEPFPQAMIFGCEPDYNAWTGKENPKPTLKGKMANLRTCGGHIHVETSLPKDLVIRAMDLCLGIPMISLETDVTYNGQTRKKLYGKFGAYRPKSYGVEYRTLSNTWCNIPGLSDFVWDATAQALDMVQKDLVDLEKLGPVIQQVGNSGNWEAATGLMSAFDLLTPSNYSKYDNSF